VLHLTMIPGRATAIAERAARIRDGNDWASLHDSSLVCRPDLPGDASRQDGLRRDWPGIRRTRHDRPQVTVRGVVPALVNAGRER
jgi:hypothetical protein